MKQSGRSAIWREKKPKLLSQSSTFHKKTSQNKSKTSQNKTKTSADKFYLDAIMDSFVFDLVKGHSVFLSKLCSN